MSASRVSLTWQDLVELAEPYITPDDPSIQNWAQQIINSLQTKGEDTPRGRMIAAYDKVAVDIIYRSDIEVHGQVEYWQLPSETISLGSGNCEDTAFLLCSLHKALDIHSRVDFGIYRGIGHAWVEAYDDSYGGYMETTTERPFSGFVDPSLYTLEAWTSFNGEPTSPQDILKQLASLFLPGTGLLVVGSILMLDDAHDFGKVISTSPPIIDISWIVPASLIGPHPPWPHHWIIGLLLLVLGIILLALALVKLATMLLTILGKGDLTAKGK